MSKAEGCGVGEQGFVTNLKIKLARSTRLKECSLVPSGEILP
jgi:hypothetical protein